MIRVSHIEEPMLEFGGGGRHVDIRFGLAECGPFDATLAERPSEVRIGIVGTAETVEKAEAWIDQCQREIDPKPSRQPNLFPGFPGLAVDGPFGCGFSTPDSLQRILTEKQMREVLARPSQPEIVRAAAELIANEIKGIAETGRPSVIMIALPVELLTATYLLSQQAGHRKKDEEEDDENNEGDDATVPGAPLNLRGVQKAICMPERVPIQLLWPSTADPSVKIPRKLKEASDYRVQDDATRAWNFTTGLYYKGGGLPWRLTRDPKELRTSYVGVSFYRSVDRGTVQTSTAQMFDERGEGLILRGGAAAEASTDRRPHLMAEDAGDLLKRSLKAFRDNHGHYPARVVVHKSSNFNEEEIAGFNAALDAFDIDYADYIYMARSMVRLYRTGSYPPLRGSLIRLENNQAVLYTRGSVEFFRTYPGMYVPRSLLLRAQRLGQPMTHVADETLALTKMNWNNTQFDGGRPVTLVASEQVGDILKYVDEADMERGNFAQRYSYYM